MAKSISRILILLAILFSKFESQAQAQDSSHQGQVSILLPFFVNADVNETQKVIESVTDLLNEDFNEIAYAKCSVIEFMIPLVHWATEITVFYECHSIDRNLPVHWEDANDVIASFLRNQTGYSVIFMGNVGAIVIGGNENENQQ